MLIIGSAAMHHWFPESREPALDTDYIATTEEIKEFVAARVEDRTLLSAEPLSDDSFLVRTVEGGKAKLHEFRIAWPGTTDAELLKTERVFNNKYAYPEVLFILKLSHKYKKNSPHFLKTMRDLQFLRDKGIKYSDIGVTLQDIYKRRKKETYNYKLPSLQTDKVGFFKDVYTWEHDDIHKAVAVGDAPAYTKFSKDGAEVEVDREKWNKLPHYDKLLAGLEESYVLAIERSLVPHPGKLTLEQAFLKALEKVCTSITSGWFRKFCYDNYDAIKSLYSDSYYAKFLAAVERGEVRKYGSQ